VQGIIFKYLDMNTANLVRSEGNYNSDYHRPLFKTREYRSEFLKLPRAFQGSSHFGDDILDNTKLSEFLMARELRLTSDIGNCFLFSGHTTIHRGGIVNKGERWVFQMAFKKS
jgi:hypothetical protein